MGFCISSSIIHRTVDRGYDCIDDDTAKRVVQFVADTIFQELVAGDDLERFYYSDNASFFGTIVSLHESERIDLANRPALDPTIRSRG